MTLAPAVSARNSSSLRYSVVFLSFCAGVMRPTMTAVSTFASDMTNSFIQRGVYVYMYVLLSVYFFLEGVVAIMCM